MSQPEDSNVSSSPKIRNQAGNPEKPKKKKNKLKTVIWVLFVMMLLALAWFGLKALKPDVSGPRINPLTLIPENATVILESDQPYALWKKLSGTDIWQLLQEDDEWKEYGLMLNELETTLSSFDMALDLLSSRSVLVSSHPYRGSETDFLYIIDVNGLGILRTWLTSQSGLTKRTYKDHTLYELLDNETKETLSFCFENNYLIASYTHTLVEASIRAKMEANLARDLDFIEVKKEVLGQGLVRLYINYDRLYTYLKKLISREDVENISQQLPLLFTGSYLDIHPDNMLLKGFSNFDDSLQSTLKLFKSGGTGRSDISRVLPANTSIYLSLGASSFDRFFQELDVLASNDPITGKDYRDCKKKTEKFLDISIERDIIGWIDDEIAVAQIEGSSSESALIIKGKNEGLVKESMDFLTRQIKRKTPVRFKGVDYKGYEINYLAVKGLFNVILGSIFKKYDRPYFTIIDEYVIFGSTPTLLREMIDSHENENVLYQSENYETLISELGKSHSLLFFIQTELLHQSSGGMIDDETVRFLSTKSHFFSSFPMMSISLSPSGENLLETNILFSINKDEPFDNLAQVPTQVDSTIFTLDSLFEMDPGDQLKLEEVALQDLGAKKQSEEYEEGIPKYDVEIKDGLKHGSYYEYHPSGDLKAKGKYKNDLKDGTWKYYSPEGKLIKKEKYRDGELVGG